MLHLVGLIGIAYDVHSPLLPLTPFNLWTCALLVMGLHVLESPKDLWWFLLVFVLGWAVECLGVNTGFPFGAYHYAENFGWAPVGTPLLIGLNWVMLTYCATAVRRALLPKFPNAPVVGGILVALDLLAEQMAPLLGFWQFENNPVPLENYISWFVIGTAMGWTMERIHPVRNPSAYVLLIMQFLFFSTLVLRYV